MTTATITPRIAITAVVHNSEYRLGVAEENVAGYTPVKDAGPYPSWEKASAAADEYNARLGLSKKFALLIITSSMWPMLESDHAERVKNWK